jgi:hypothetical protein
MRISSLSAIYLCRIFSLSRLNAFRGLPLTNADILGIGSLLGLYILSGFPLNASRGLPLANADFLAFGIFICAENFSVCRGQLYASRGLPLTNADILAIGILFGAYFLSLFSLSASRGLPLANADFLAFGKFYLGQISLGCKPMPPEVFRLPMRISSLLAFYWG